MHVQAPLLDQRFTMIDIKDAVLLAKARIKATNLPLTPEEERRIFQRQGSGDLLDDFRAQSSKREGIKRSQSAHPSVGRLLAEASWRQKASAAVFVDTMLCWCCCLSGRA